MRETDAQLVDVRTPEEHGAGRISGDVLIELEELPARAQTVALRDSLVPVLGQPQEVEDVLVWDVRELRG